MSSGNSNRDNPLQSVVGAPGAATAAQGDIDIPHVLLPPTSGTGRSSYVRAAATDAAGSATDAAGSATDAAGSATAAGTSAGRAEGAAAAAGTSAGLAQGAATAAETAAAASAVGTESSLAAAGEARQQAERSEGAAAAANTSAEEAAAAEIATKIALDHAQNVVGDLRQQLESLKQGGLEGYGIISDRLNKLTSEITRLDAQQNADFKDLTNDIEQVSKGLEQLAADNFQNREAIQRLYAVFVNGFRGVVATLAQQQKDLKTTNESLELLKAQIAVDANQSKTELTKIKSEYDKKITDLEDSVTTGAATNKAAAEQQIKELKTQVDQLTAQIQNLNNPATPVTPGATPGAAPGAAAPAPTRLGMDIDLIGNSMGGKELKIIFYEGTVIRIKYIEGGRYAKVMREVMTSPKFGNYPDEVQKVLKGKLKLVYGGKVVYKRKECTLPPPPPPPPPNDCWASMGFGGPPVDEEIKGDTVHVVGVSNLGTTGDEDLFKEFTTKYNENLKGSRISMYNNEEIKIDCNADGTNIFQKLERELFYSTYSEYLRNYLDCNDNPLYNRLGSVWELSALYTGKANISATFKLNYGAGDDKFYKVFEEVLKGDHTGGETEYMNRIDNVDPSASITTNETTKYNAAHHLTSSAQKYENYEVFIKEVCDYINGELKWLNEQIKLGNADEGECIFKTYKKYREIYDNIFNIQDKCGSSGPHYPVWCRLDKNITKEQFLNVLSQAKSEYPEDYEKFIKDINEKRVKIGLLPCTQSSNVPPTEDSGDGDDDDEEESNKNPIQILNDLLNTTKGILNSKKSSESSETLIQLIRHIQNDTNSDELSKYFVNSAQSLSNRVQPKPVDPDDNELPKDSPILIEQSKRTLYLQLNGSQIDDNVSIESSDLPKATDNIGMNGDISSVRDSLERSTTNNQYPHFINDDKLIIVIKDGDEDKYKLGMELTVSKGNETVIVGKIEKIVKMGNSKLKYKVGENFILSGTPYIVISITNVPTKFMKSFFDCKKYFNDRFTDCPSFTGDFSGMYQKNVILTEENEDNQNPNYFLLFYDDNGNSSPSFKFKDTERISVEDYKDLSKNYGPVSEEQQKEKYEQLLTSIFNGIGGMDWTDTFTLEGMKLSYKEKKEDGVENKLLISLIAKGSTSSAIQKLKNIETYISEQDPSVKPVSGGLDKLKKTPGFSNIHLRGLERKTDGIKGIRIGNILLTARDEKFSPESIGVRNRKMIQDLKKKVLKGTLKYGVAGLLPMGIPLVVAKDLYENRPTNTTSDPNKAYSQKGGADSSWIDNPISSREKKNLGNLKRSLDYSFNIDSQNNKELKNDIMINENLKSDIKDDIEQIIGQVQDNPINPNIKKSKEEKDSKTKDLEDKLKNLIKEQNRNKSSSSSSNSDLSRQISALKGQLSAQQRPQQSVKPVQQSVKPVQQSVKPAQQSVKPAQQPVKPGQVPVKPGQVPGQPVPSVPGQQVPGEPGTEDKSPSLLDRLFSGTSSEKEQLDKEREEFEKQKEDDEKEKQMKEKMEELKKVETIQTDLFKQLPDKSSPEYEKVKKLMIEQIKLIHKYNLLKQESFQLMLENSKCQTLEDENKEQKAQIKDLENKIFNIIQQILGSKTSNKGLNKLNRDLLSYIDDLKSTNPDGSLVDTDKYLDLIKSFKHTSRKRTLRKVKKNKDTKSAKDEKKKKTPNKLRKKMTPKKETVKRTPVKPKITKVYKNKRTPTKSKSKPKVKRTPTKPKK